MIDSRKEAVPVKRVTALLSALAIGFAYCLPGTTVLAADSGEQPVGIEENCGNPAEDESGDEEEKEREEKKEDVSEEISGLEKLQIPQKLDVVIDPWKMDGKEQVYSETYKIHNTGETDGVLTFSRLTCNIGEDSGVIVRTDKDGLHDNGDKAIYIEMLLGNEETIVLSTENVQYETKIEAGGELSLRFSGEVNENAFGKWKGSDIAVSVVYSWDMEKEDADREELNGKQADGGSVEEKSEKSKISGEQNEMRDENDSETEEQDSESQGGENGRTDDFEMDETKNVELLESQNVKVVIDSWKIDAEGRIVSPEYMLYNAGDTKGIWTLSEILCKSWDSGSVTFQTEKEALYDSEDRSVYMELVLGNGDRVFLSQKESEYHVELKPEEKLSVRFVGEVNGNLFEAQEGGDIAVTAVSSWNAGEPVSE